MKHRNYPPPWLALKIPRQEFRHLISRHFLNSCRIGRRLLLVGINNKKKNKPDRAVSGYSQIWVSQRRPQSPPGIITGTTRVFFHFSHVPTPTFTTAGSGNIVRCAEIRSIFRLIVGGRQRECEEGRARDMTNTKKKDSLESGGESANGAEEEKNREWEPAVCLEMSNSLGFLSQTQIIRIICLPYCLRPRRREGGRRHRFPPFHPSRSLHAVLFF